MRKEIVFLLIVLVLAAGCTSGQQLPADAKKSALPSVTGWNMKEIDAYSMEGFTVKESMYESSGKFVKLAVVTSDDEAKTKNKIEEMAFSNIEKLKEESGGVIGENNAKYIADEQFKIIFFAEGKTGYIGISDSADNLREFFSGIYENVFIDV